MAVLCSIVVPAVTLLAAFPAPHVLLTIRNDKNQAIGNVRCDLGTSAIEFVYMAPRSSIERTVSGEGGFVLTYEHDGKREHA